MRDFLHNTVLINNDGYHPHCILSITFSFWIQLWFKYFHLEDAGNRNVQVIKEVVCPQELAGVSHKRTVCVCVCVCVCIYIYRGCPRRNVPDFGRVFLTLKYINLTQNTYIQAWTVTEIMAREKCGLLVVPCTVPVSRIVTRTLRMSVLQSQPSQAHSDFIINRCYRYSEL